MTPKPITWDCGEIMIHSLAVSRQKKVYIELRYEMNGKPLFAVTDGSFVLNRDLDWEHEPLPSSRDEAFFTRCRYSTFEEALAMVERLAV